MGKLSDILAGWDEPANDAEAEAEAKKKQRSELLFKPPTPEQQGERKVSLGDVAKARKDYEREPLERGTKKE
jgi:hypothetical protein